MARPVRPLVCRRRLYPKGRGSERCMSKDIEVLLRRSRLTKLRVDGTFALPTKLSKVRCRTCGNVWPTLSRAVPSLPDAPHV